MAGPFDDLQIGESRTTGGAGIDALVIGPFLFDTNLEIYAWHTGVKTGEGNSAYLTLSHDGAEIGKDQDQNFDNYSLRVAKTIRLAKLASTSLTIRYDNTMATRCDYGLKITFTMLG